MADPRKSNDKIRSPEALYSEYTDEEEEFIRAMAAWQRRTGVKFPTYTQVLAVAVSLGYRKTGK